VSLYLAVVWRHEKRKSFSEQFASTFLESETKQNRVGYSPRLCEKIEIVLTEILLKMKSYKYIIKKLESK
jgi:hypothetical protein